MPPHQPASPTVAALLSGLIPGLGHWYAGHRRRAVVLIGITAIAVVPVMVLVIVIFIGHGRAFALDLIGPFFRHPGYLLVLLGANAGVLVFRILAGVDAFRLVGNKEGGMITKRIVAVTAAAAIFAMAGVAPQVWAAQRNLALYDLLTFDYSLDPNQASPQPTAMVGTTVPAPADTSVDPQSTTTTTPSSTTTTTLPPLPQERLNILLLGSDAGPGRTGVRTDTIIVASVDPSTGRAALMQLPRNTIDLPIPPGHPAYDVWRCHCFPRISNEIYQYGLAHPELFPGGNNSGARAVMDLVGYLYGIEIHRYALADLQGFVGVVDALGGVTITVTPGVDGAPFGASCEPTPEFGPGTYDMTASQALRYARERRSSNDYHRMTRQACVLTSLAAQANPTAILQALPALAPAIQESIRTDFLVAEWPDLIDLGRSVDTASSIAVRFMPNAPELAGTGTAYSRVNSDGYWIPNVEVIRDTVVAVLSPDR